MSEWTQELRRRLAMLNLPPAEEAGIIAELSLHLDERVAELVGAGRTRAEARRLALDDLSEAELRQGGWRKLPVPAPPDPPPGAAFPRLLDGPVGQADHGELGQSPAGLGLDVDAAGLQAGQPEADGAGDHAPHRTDQMRAGG